MAPSTSIVQEPEPDPNDTALAVSVPGVDTPEDVVSIPAVVKVATDPIDETMANVQ